MKDHEVVLHLLRRIAVRLWLNRALTELGFGISVAFFALIAFRLLQPALGQSAVNAAAPMVLVGLAVFGGYLVWRAMTPASPMQAAAAADSAAGLKDELKSAYWFLSNAQESGFVRLQVDRAARRAVTLQARKLVPLRLPRVTGLAIMLAAALFITDRSVSEASRDWTQRPAAIAETGDSIEKIRGLLGDVGSEPEIEKLDQSLATVGRDDAPIEQVKRAVLDAREAADALNMRATAVRENLASMAREMQGRAGFAEVAKALAEGNTQQALDRLENMRAEHAKDRPTAEEVDQQSGEASRSALKPPDSAEESTRALGNLTAKINEEALGQVLKKIEDAQKVLEAQDRVRQVNRRMNDFLATNSQRSALTASRFGNRADAANPTPSPETGSTTMQGGTMFRQGAAARGDDDQASNEGNKAGAASGHSAADPLEGIATERLEATLKREEIRLHDSTAQQDSGGEKSWFYSPTEASVADTAYADVRARETYDRTEVMKPENIPMRQRQLVKDYFINLHKSEQR